MGVAKADTLATSGIEEAKMVEALIDAAARGNITHVRDLLAAGAQIRQWGTNGSTPLHSAAYCNQVEVVQMLLDLHADPDIHERGGSRSTPLHAAAIHGHLAIVAMLKGAGADPAATDAWGRTPRQVAQLRGQFEVSDLLAASAISSELSGTELRFSSGAAPMRQAEHAALECKDRVAEEIEAKKSQKAFFGHNENSAIFEAAGLGKLFDSPDRLLVCMVSNLSTKVFDAHHFAEPFEFGIWSVGGTRVLREEMSRLASSLGRTTAYTNVLVVLPIDYGRWAQWPQDVRTRNIEEVIATETEGSPILLLGKTLQQSLPTANVHVYNSSCNIVTGLPTVPQFELSFGKLQAKEAKHAFFESRRNAIVFEQAGLGDIKDPKLLVVILDFPSDPLTGLPRLGIRIFDLYGLADFFQFGFTSAGGTPALSAELSHRQPTMNNLHQSLGRDVSRIDTGSRTNISRSGLAEHGLEEDQTLMSELSRLGSVVTGSASNYTTIYTRVLLIGLRGHSPFPNNAWTRSLKSFLNAEPEVPPLRALHMTLRGAVPKAKLLVLSPNCELDIGRK